jgi:transposase
LVRRCRATVERVLHRYQEAGVDGVPHRRRPGWTAEVPTAWADELRRVIELDPHIVGVDSANWTTRLRVLEGDERQWSPRNWQFSYPMRHVGSSITAPIALPDRSPYGLGQAVEPHPRTCDAGTRS